VWVECPTELDAPVLIFGFEVGAAGFRPRSWLGGVDQRVGAGEQRLQSAGIAPEHARTVTAGLGLGRARQIEHRAVLAAVAHREEQRVLAVVRIERRQAAAAGPADRLHFYDIRAQITQQTPAELTPLDSQINDSDPPQRPNRHRRAHPARQPSRRLGSPATA